MRGLARLARDEAGLEGDAGVADEVRADLCAVAVAAAVWVRGLPVVV